MQIIFCNYEITCINVQYIANTKDKKLSDKYVYVYIP